MPSIAIAPEETAQRRLFSRYIKQLCWKKAPTVAGRDPDRWRLDAVGNPVCAALKACDGCACHEYDHIIPYSRGGSSTDVDNCQILQTRVNQMKGNEDDDKERLRGYSCRRRFNEEEMDVIEMAVYGSVNRQERQCRCWSVQEAYKKFAHYYAGGEPKKGDWPDCL